FVFSSRRRHTRSTRDWSSDVCSSDLGREGAGVHRAARLRRRSSIDTGALAPGSALTRIEYEQAFFRHLADRVAQSLASEAGALRSEERRVGREGVGGVGGGM